MDPSAPAVPTSLAKAEASEVPILDALSERECRFAMFYLQSGNEMQAAIEAGYSEKTAAKKAYAMLRRPQVIAFLKEQLELRFNGDRMQVPEILARLAWLARGDKRKLFNPDGSYKPIAELDEQTAFCVAGWEDELKFNADGAPPEMTRKVKWRDPHAPLRTLAQVSQLLAAETTHVNVFIDLADRLDAASKRLTQQRKKNVEDAKIIEK